MTSGQRIRVLLDNGRDDIVGFPGTIRQVVPSGYVVVLDNDPALGRSMYTPGGFVQFPKDREIRRFFYPYQIEPLD